MDRIEESELQSGLVIFVIPSIAGDDAGTETNAKQTVRGDYSIQKGHLFILIDIMNDARWLAAPIFSVRENEKWNKDRYYLDNERKEGHAHAWIGEVSYVFKLQHWIIPAGAIVNASVQDRSPANNRRFYAKNDQNELKYLAKLAASNPTPFHRPNPVSLRKI